MTYSDIEDQSWFISVDDGTIVPQRSNMDSRYCSLVRLVNIMETAEQVVFGTTDGNGGSSTDFVIPEPTPLAPGVIHPSLSSLYGCSMPSTMANFNSHQESCDFPPASAHWIPNESTSMQVEGQFRFSPSRESVRSSVEDSLSSASSGFPTDPLAFFESTECESSPSTDSQLMVPPPQPVSRSSSYHSSTTLEDDIKWMTTLSFPRKFQAGQWNERFKDLMQFKEEHGHLLVPHSYPPNQKLAQWVKRQRYQHRLKTMNRHTTLTDDREQILLDVGFVWDSHRAAWQYHFQCLENFALHHGTCNLPAAAMSSLRTWCKHQRRQYKSYRAGEESTMTLEKIRCLEEIGFDWNPRGL